MAVEYYLKAALDWCSKVPESQFYVEAGAKALLAKQGDLATVRSQIRELRE